MKLAFWLISLIAALAFPSSARPAPDFVSQIEKLRVGMTAAEVVGVLGEPNFKLSPDRSHVQGEAWFYRFATLEERGGGSADNTLIGAGRLRCVLRDGALAEMAGLWPKPQRPPSGTPKEKILLIDVAKVYDSIAATREFNEWLRQQDREQQAAVAEMNTAGKQLVARYSQAQDEIKRAAPADKKSREEAARALLGEIQAKQKEIQDFIARMKRGFAEALRRRIDATLPAISEAILKFKREHGYAFAFEIKQNVLSTATKPLLVSGVDVTSDVVKWIDAGNAAGTGL
jgi:Skp family chaperone for outer membrane proteins